MTPILWISACTRPPMVQGAPSLAEAPDAPLARRLSIAADRAARLSLEVDDGAHPFTVAFPEVGTAFDVPILGVGPDRDVALTAVLTDDHGRESRTALAPYHTAAIDGWPTVELLALDKDRVEPGFRLVSLEIDGDPFTLAALRPDGEPAWLYTGDINWGDARLTPEGTVVGLGDGAWEMDLLGTPLRHWTAHPTDPIDVRLEPVGLSHELHPLDDGTFATISTDTFEAPAYPDSYDPPTPGGPAALLAEHVVRFDPDGTVLDDWASADLLDTSRIGFDSLDPTSSGFDWAHLNAVIPYDGGLLVEVRHQDALFLLDPDGAIRWILGDPAGWHPQWEPLLLRPVGDFVWPYHPHGPSVDADGDIVLFDNHDWGHTPYTPAPDGVVESRVAAFHVDEDAHTVSLAWDWTAPGNLYSGALGDAQALPVTGDVLAAYSFLDAEAGVTNESKGLGTKSVRLIEIHPGEEAPVADLRISAPKSLYPGGVKAYRAIVVPSLYPDGVVVTDTN
jgi:hypothetical protein